MFVSKRHEEKPFHKNCKNERFHSLSEERERYASPRLSFPLKWERIIFGWSILEDLPLIKARSRGPGVMYDFF
jgi:hypothetical protein